jgi:hypothetical protein
MKINMFYRNFTRKFSSSINPYHHDFNPGNLSSNQALVAFDFLRIIFYSFLIAKISINSVSFLLFRKKNFQNNPDFAIIDEKTFLSLKSEKEVSK